jgi:hypothetical protein
MADTVTVPLSEPLKAHDRELTELVLKRPRTKELRRASDGAKGEVDTMCRLLSECAGVPTSAIDTLSLDDFMAAVDGLAELLPEQLKPSPDLMGKVKAPEVEAP